MFATRSILLLIRFLLWILTLPFLYVLVPFLLARPSLPVPSSGIVSTSGFLDYKIQYSNALFQD